MADSDQVLVTLRVQNSGIARQGFGKPLVVSHNAGWAERTRTYSSYAGVLGDWAADSPEAMAAKQIFSQSPHPEAIGIGRAASAVRQKYKIAVAAVALGSTYKVDAAGQGVTGTTVSYKTLADQTFVGSNAGDLATAVAHGMSTGDGPYRVSNAGGGLPTGLAVDTDYWIIKLTADTYQFATSKANAIALTAIVLNSDGTGTQTLRRNQNDVICAQLLQGLNAIVGKNFTAVQQVGAGETDYLEVTANADGNWFSLSVGDVALLSIAQTHAGTGLAAELAAILLADSSWYWLVTTYNSTDYVAAAAAWVEPNGRAYIPELVESAAITTAYIANTSTDEIAVLDGLADRRTLPFYHHVPSQFMGAALTGRLAPLKPGSWTAKFKSLTGVTPSPLNTTHRTNLVNRRGNGYMTEMGRPMTFDGTVGDLDFGFLDVTVGLDAFIDDLRKAIFGVEVSNDKVPADDVGIAMFEAAAKGSVKRYSAPERQVFRDNDALQVIPPTLEDFDATTRALSNFRVQGELASPVHRVLIDLTVTNN